MMRSTTRKIREVDLLDAGLLVTGLVLAIGTGAVILTPAAAPVALAPALDLVLDTTALLVTVLVALLAWVRFRERREIIAAYQAAAFLALAIGNGAAVLMTLTAGLTVAQPDQAQPWVFAGAATVASVLLVAGTAGTLRRSEARHPVAMIAATTLVMLAVVAMTHGNPGLPAHVVPTAAGPETLGVTPLASAVHLLNAALFALATVLGRRLWRRGATVGDAYVTVGLMIAAFGEVHGALFANAHPGPVTSVDLLRLLFGVVLLLAIDAEARAMMRSLQSANTSLERLRQAEVDRASLEERARLSRELHDGLAQTMWLAKLKIGRLIAGAQLDSLSKALASEADEAVDIALAEARQAVLAMRVSADDGATFCSLMSRYVEEFEERFGIPVEFTCTPDFPRLPTRTQAEVLRIAQEALANVRRHASANVVRVSAEALPGGLHLTVVDDGQGFDVAATGGSSFGLAGMHERAGLIGGRLSVESAPGNGTRVDLLAPLSPAAVAGATRG